MNKIYAGVGAGDLPEPDEGTISFEGQTKQAKCENCRITSLHVFSGRWFCKKCGQSNNELTFAELNVDMNTEEFAPLSTTDMIDSKSSGTSPMVQGIVSFIKQKTFHLLLNPGMHQILLIL